MITEKYVKQETITYIDDLGVERKYGVRDFISREEYLKNKQKEIYNIDIVSEPEKISYTNNNISYECGLQVKTHLKHKLILFILKYINSEWLYDKLVEIIYKDMERGVVNVIN